MRFTIPVRTISEANGREHFRVKAKRAKEQRAMARMFAGQWSPFPKPPLVITITRIGVRGLDDDNLASSQKAVRDGIADALGIDDGDKRLSWRYEQRKGKPKEYAVEVEIAQLVPNGVQSP